MKLAIHHTPGSFSERWIDYCKEQNIPYKIVNCFENDIIYQLQECHALMWHFHQETFKDVLLAKQLLFAVEQSGKTVFPNFNTSWHFDDKVGQKYLLEAIDAPLVPSIVFYDKEKALQWAEETSFPKVLKLRGGAGALNVSLVRSKKEAIKKIRTAFGKGFSQFNGYTYFLDTLKKYKANLIPTENVLRSLGRMLIGTSYSRLKGKEKGYIYFQEFIPNNDSDIRVIVINNKAFAIKRQVRKGDFRASGSGKIIYLNDSTVDKECLKIAFEISRKLGSQCLAYDFVYDKNNNPLIVEISYGFAVAAYDFCPGFWNHNMAWHEGKFNPQSWMVESVLEEVKKKEIV